MYPIGRVKNETTLLQNLKSYHFQNAGTQLFESDKRNRKVFNYLKF
jgi:hypothetical protein